jgi:restriction endonuclease Mrr
LLNSTYKNPQPAFRRDTVRSRGLFISYSGFSPDGLHAFERGEKAIICLSGDELAYILAHNLDVVSALRLKARHAAETGEVFIPLQDLLSRS